MANNAPLPYKRESHWLSSLLICLYRKPDLCQRGKQNMNYWSGLKAGRRVLLLLCFSCFLWILLKGASQMWFCLSKPCLKQLPQQNQISEFLQHVAAGHLWANNISTDLLTPSCLDMCLIYRLDFLHPLGRRLPLCVFCSAEWSQLGGCVCQMTPRHSAYHTAPPHPLFMRQLTVVVLWKQRGEGDCVGWEV